MGEKGPESDVSELLRDNHGCEEQPLSQEITSADIRSLADGVLQLSKANVLYINAIRELIDVLQPKQSMSFQMDIPGLPGALGDRQPTPVELQCYLLGIQNTLKTDEVDGNLASESVRNVFSELGLPSIECYGCDESHIFSLCENLKGKWYCEHCAASKKKSM